MVTPDVIRMARDMLPNPENGITAIAKLIGVSPGTLYNHIPDLRELRADGCSASSAARPNNRSTALGELSPE